MKAALALAIVSGLIISLVLRVQFIGLVEANPTVGGYWENSNTVAVPLEITILSPKNTTYSSNNINFTLQITKTETQDPMEVGQFYIFYILDFDPYGPPSLSGEDVVNNDCTPEIYYNTVLHNLADGQHHLLVSVECFPENVSAYWWKTKTYAEAAFYIDTGSGTPAPTIAPTPTPSPEPIQLGEYPEGPRLLWNRTISEWNETAGQYRHSFANKIIQASDGGYVVAGGSNGSSSGDWYDWWLVKTDSNANVEWEKTFGGPYQDFADSVIQTSDGGYAISGTMNSQTSMQAVVVKTDSAGNKQWSRNYSNSTHTAIIQTSDGGYAIAGNDYTPLPYFTFFGPSPIIRLVKTDALGNEEWRKTYGDGTAYLVIQTRDGGYALFGSNLSGLIFIKTDSLGELEWKNTYGVKDDYALSVVQTSDGAFVLFGIITVDRRCPGLIKIDAEGNILWAKNYLPDRAIPSNMVVTRDGGYIFSATEDWTTEKGFVVEIVKVDSQGNISWVISFAESSGPVLVSQTSDGGYALVETRNLRDYDSWKEHYSAVWIIKTEKDPANPIATVSPPSTPSPEAPLLADSPEPTPTLTPDPYNETQLELDVILGLAVTVAVIGVGLGLLVYLIKRK